MKWFGGTIAEAITFAQGQKATFVAFVEGSCAKSKMMLKVFEDREVCNNLECSRFVCIKIEAYSIGYRQLVEIYKTVPIPSLFYISHSGVPLDIVSGDLFKDVNDLKEAVFEATIKCNKLNSSQVSSPKPDVPQDRLLHERRRQIEDILEARRKGKEVQKPTELKPEKSTDEVASNSEDLDEKKKAILAERDAEFKKMAEEREKERKAEALAKKKILEQIAEDRADRAARMKFATVSNQSEKQAKTEVPDTPPSSTQARIQFRMPTGESRSTVFPKDTTLLQIRDYIDENLELPYRDYKLATTFPRKEFTTDDNGSTLQDLNLVPTAVLLILANAGSKVNPYARNWVRILIDLVNDLLQPLYSASTYIRGFIWRPAGEQATSSPEQQPSQSSAEKDKPRTYVRKRGNVHSLKDLRDGNDENNTWNGNSTQQM